MRTGTALAQSTSAVARLQRRLVVDTDRPVVVAVMPLDQRTATSPVTAMLATVLQALTPVPVAAVDADGTAQPLRPLLDSSGAGDLIGLASSHSASLRRRAVEDFIDVAARVPLASCWLDGPGAIPPGVLQDAMWKLRRRYPTLVVDVPHGVPVPTIAAVADSASHVVLVGDGTDIAHDWLHTGKSVVSRLASRDSATVVAIGGDESTRGECSHGDIIPIPGVRGRADAGELADPDLLYALGEVVVRIFEMDRSATG